VRRQERKESGPVVTVDVAPVLLKNIDRTIRADGLLFPRQQAAIVPKITAPVKKWYVQRGSRVRAGQLLVELENKDLQGAATESSAALSQAEATFETTSRATVPEELQKAVERKAGAGCRQRQQQVFDNRAAAVS
jgi:multidrug efflux pump subunit AcrA (membrane-fusion protein)